METYFEKTERTYIKLIMGGFGALLLFVVLCWGGFRGYRHWQEGHLVRRAAAFMSGGDLKTASLNARRALQLNSSNIDATRLMADIAEKNRDRAALELRRKVVELNPSNTDDSLALVRSALWFNDVASAEKTIERLEATANAKPEFHAAAGRLAEMKKDATGAESHWSRAVELAPKDTAYRFQLALVRLGLNDPTKRTDALAVLEELRADAAQRSAATRALIIDGIIHHADAQRSRDLAQALTSYSDANFSDRLIYLEILRQLQDSAYGDYLARLKSEATTSPADLAALLSWMLRNKMYAEAIEYGSGLPAEKMNEWPLPVVMAEARAQAKDWVQLEKQARESNWARYDFLRRAYLARALRAQDKQLAAEQELSAAQKEAEANPQMVSMLTQTFAEWGWRNEAVELLWALTKNPATKSAALRALYQHYRTADDTPGLYRTLAKLAEDNPTDTALQNNLAQVSLLIGADVDHARKVAAEISAKEPINPAYVSTYAFALMSKGDMKGALRLMDSLSEEQLRDPATATYYGLILAGAGQKEKARGFLRRSREAQLLPEEKALVAKAESSLE